MYAHLFTQFVSGTSNSAYFTFIIGRKIQDIASLLEISNCHNANIN